MSEISIVETKETIFFSHERGALCQWILVTIENHFGQALAGTVAIEAGSEEVVTQLEVLPGVREYRCYAPTLWPAHPPVPVAPVRLAVGSEIVTSTASVGTHRPWTVYLLSDACTDYTWVYDDVADVHAHDAAITEAEMAQVEETRDAPETDRNHYNFVHAREVEFYLERYPDQAERLFDHIRQGTLTLNPIFNMCLTGDMSLEELIRQFYPARGWARAHGLEVRYANHQETPTIASCLVPVLAGSGVGHLVKSILPYECPWAARLEEPPVFLWEGPDGSRILVRRRNKDYVEGNFVLRDVRATNTALHDQILPDYERLAERYPFDAVALVGCYGDLAPHSQDLPAKKVATISAYNAQGWEYPRLVNASHEQFWGDVDRQIAARSIQVPVYRGDYGASWEAWPASLAYDFAGWRRAQERAATADRLAAILSCLDPGWYQAKRQRLAQGWRNLTYLADHAWNGANGANRALNARLRRQWQAVANQAFDTVIADGLAALGQYIPTGDEERIVVFNGLGWSRTGIVRLAMEHLPSPPPLPEGEREAGVCLVDVATGKPVPTQIVEQDGQPVLYFEAHDVPSVGYRTFTLSKSGAISLQSPTSNSESAIRNPHSAFRNPHTTFPKAGSFREGPAIRNPQSPAPTRLESPFYSLEVSPITGGIVSLYDKIRGKELVDPDSPYHLNQCLYFSDGVEHTPQAATVESGPCGPVFGQLIVRAALKNTTLTTTITLYANLDRVDIRNEMEKLPTAEKQELDFAFPFRVPERQYRFEAPGAIVTPGACPEADRRSRTCSPKAEGTDQRPGSGQAVTAVRHLVDVFNDEFGVTLSQADSGLVEFGHRTTGEDPLEPEPGNSTVLALALQNCIDWHEAIRDQAGVTRFVFRYSLRGHGGGFDPVAAVRFGWEDNAYEYIRNELLAVTLPAGQQGDLPPDAHSFLEIKPDHVILTALKVAEEEGLIARLWECAGQDAIATVNTSGLGPLRAARKTDLLERDSEDLSIMGGEVLIPVKARGLTTARLLL